MDGLKGRLEAAYREFHASAAGTDNMNESSVTRSVDLWVLALRDAFYSPHKPAQDTSVSKFLLLERSLLEALEAISQQLHSAFWEFIVRCVIALSHEPVADAEPLQKAPQVSAELPPVTPTGNTDVKTKRKAKQTRTKTQPNAPVAFVLVSALKKLVTGPESERNAQGCLLVSQGNTVLRQFCQHELDPQMRKVDIKLLVEILDLFQVDFVSEDQVRALVADLLATKQHSSVIKLVQSFRSRVDWDFADLMRAMIRSKDWGSAELVAKTFEEDTEHKALAKMLVEEAIQYHDFKRAHRIVFNFGLQHDYPHIDQLYSRDALLKLIEKQKWALALAYVGSDATLQNVLLSHLVAAREWRHAMTLARDRMGMDDFDPEEQVQLSEQLAKNGESSSLAVLPVNGYLELPLQQESIVFCETVEAVNEAASYINNLDPATQHMIGLDVEWRPTSTKIAAHTGTLTTTAVASILQIATKSKVFIIDLLTLHNCDFLFKEFLLRLFSSDRFLKVGFGFDSDLKVLHQTFPERDAFRAVAPFLELSSVIQKVFGATVGNSLSNATARILGKPLDKRMQLSNWDERPLSHSQVVYAALDAFCLLQIVGNIQISGLTDDKGAITSWDDVASTMINIVGLSSPIDDVASIAEAVQYRMKYHAEWESKLHNHGVIESKDLVACSEVQVFWNNRMLDTSDEIDGTLGLLPTQELRPLLAVVEEQPMAYVAVNSICFFADEKPCVACIDSNSKLDTSRLAGICGISRRKVKLAAAMECETIWGFSPGTVPPFGHRTTVEHPTIPIFVDVNLQDYDKWVTGSGAHDQLLVFSSAAFFRLISVKAISDIALQRNGVSRQHHQDESHSTDDSEAVNPPASDGVNEYKFLADTMVGRVGRWLRTIGIDCVIWGKKKRSPPVDSSFPDRQSALLALAAREQRIILTRDKKLADRRDAGACFVVSSDDPHQQFQEIKNHFALVLKREDMMTRCAVCNHKGFDIVDRDYVKQHMADVVGEGVLELVTDFWKCLACHKLYWVGPKYSSAYENMLAKFQDSTEV